LIPSAFGQRFFVVSSNLDLTSGGNACSLTPGDISERTGVDVSFDGTVPGQVVGSKPGNCAAYSRVNVAVADLQEMQNQFREQIDSGLKLMAENQTKGLPQAPAADARAVYTVAAAEGAEAKLASQEDAARTIEAEVRQENRIAIRR
jgi:hypothetical protein